MLFAFCYEYEPEKWEDIIKFVNKPEGHPPITEGVKVVFDMSSTRGWAMTVIEADRVESILEFLRPWSRFGCKVLWIEPVIRTDTPEGFKTFMNTPFDFSKKGTKFP